MPGHPPRLGLDCAGRPPFDPVASERRTAGQALPEGGAVEALPQRPAPKPLVVVAEHANGAPLHQSLDHVLRVRSPVADVTDRDDGHVAELAE